MPNPFKKTDKEQEELKTAIMNYLNCPCRYFPPMDNDKELMTAYIEAAQRGKREGFVPVIVSCNDILWESLILNTCEDADTGGDAYVFSEEAVAGYRENALKQPLKSGKDVINEWMKLYHGSSDYDEGIIGEIDGGEKNDSFSGYSDHMSGMTLPVVMAEIPVKNPWEVFAYLPFGGWNECPDTLQMMSVLKYWHEKYGAIPAVITHDVLEVTVPEPVSDKQEALSLAIEQCNFCSDIVFQGVETIGALADILTKSRVWYFWWD